MDEPQQYAPQNVWHDGFFAALAETGNVTKACKAVRIERKTVYKARDRDPAFRACWAEALDEAADRLEEEARRRAHDGLIRYKFRRDGTPLLHPTTGEPYYELDYSDTLLIFLLKGCRPEKYRERQDVSVTGQGGGPVQHEVGVDHEHHIDPAALTAFHADLIAAGLGHLLPDGGAQLLDSPPVESGETMQP
jgi:hypothetical protein